MAQRRRTAYVQSADCFALQQACRENDYTMFKRFSSELNSSAFANQNLRSMLTFTPQRLPIPIEQVESVDSICKRLKPAQ